MWLKTTNHQTNIYSGALFVIFLTFFMLSFADTSKADIGTDWLSAQATAEGSYSSPVEIATDFQSTSETVRALHTLDALSAADLQNSTLYLNADTLKNTEYLSRAIIINTLAGLETSSLMTDLLKHHNSDGGFAEFSGFESTSLDTAYVLEALAIAGGVESQFLGSAISFILTHQNSDGGWSTPKNLAEESSTFVTALTLKALSHYRGVYNLEQAINQGKDYLLAQQNVNALWDDPFLSALSIIALIHTTNDPAVTSDSINALKLLQQSDGSWEQDVYTTALALRALKVSEAPPVNPVLASIKGRFIDGITGLPLEGVFVAIDGPTPDSMTTSNSGTFHFTNLTVGQYTLQSVLNGYNQVTAETMTLAGNTIDFADIRLLPELNNPTTATIIGKITDLETGLPLEDVNVSISGADSDTVITDIDGAYQFTNVVIGDINLNASKIGYSSVTTNSTLIAGGVLLFSPKLTPTEMAVSAVKGTILEASTQLPLKDVLITLSGSTVAQTLTDALGNYQITNILPGAINIQASLNNYDSVSAQTNIYENNIINFSPRLYAINTTPINSNLAGIEGIVVDAGTNEALSDVLVTLTFATENREILTSIDGSFTFEGIDAASVELTFIKQGYLAPKFSMPLVPLESINIGQVRLREETVVELLPDLMVDSIDLAQTTNDLNTLELQGSISVVIGNQGTATAAATELIAFYDANNDGAYDIADDTFLGQATMANELVIEEGQNILINIQGSVPYRDAPISVWVDSSQSQIESNELNNILSTASSCLSEAPIAGNLDPIEKWHWSGSSLSPSSNQVMMTPMVAQLTDDNGDGNINTNDTPDIIFTTFSGAAYTGIGILRAISGEDGTDIWSLAPQANAMIAPAISDIDNDGLVEIVVGGPNRTGLRVYENDGTLKWQVAVSGTAQPAIADLDNDGIPEIIYNRYIYNPQGELLRTLPMGDFTLLPVDLDMDGDLEIFSQGIVYHHDGSILWDSGIRGTFGAVGNFDADDFPEIAIRTPESVTLLDHDGTLLWGPVAIPGGGGGPLTIADVDGDGEPEIGVAGARNYTIIETDGSIKWTSPTRDFSSRATGSSVFDFESDGKAEILYNDELFFRIYDGETGTILFQIQNTTGTLTEYPVVTDIDNDGHAEIVLPSNNYAFGGKTGIRVFENRDDLWAATRSIWNQHAYHINNINDDGSIPQFEQPSWLTHNSYRLNTFIDHDPLSSPDLTASQVLITDKGQNQLFDLSVRIGNAGLQTTSNTVKVNFYQGIPETSGLLLGSSSLPALTPNEYTDIQLQGVTLSNNESVYATVDTLNIETECNETNNSDHASISSIIALGKITVATDAPFYHAQTPVEFSAEVVNNSSFTQDYRVEFILKDLEGTPVEIFPSQQTGVLGSNATITLKQNWNTATILAGHYQVYAQLYDSNEQLLDEAIAPLEIVSADPALNLTVTTDKLLYQAWDQVNITGRIENTTSNAVQAASLVEITVHHPSGTVLFSDTVPLGELQPGALTDLPFILTLVDLQSGNYPVEMVLKDALNHQILSTASTHFQVERQALQALTGKIIATPVQVNRGEPVQCTETVNNRAATALGNIHLSSQLLNIDTEQVVNETERTITLTEGQSVTNTRTIDTNELSIGTYACLLTATIDGQSQNLGSAIFDVLQPPIRLDSSLDPGTQGRLLILLDYNNNDDDDEPLVHPDLQTQRTYLEQILTNAGWFYTLVRDENSFARELRTHAYTQYALLSTEAELDEQILEELREAVFNGSGLLHAGNFDLDDELLEKVMGVVIGENHETVNGLEMINSVWPITGQTDWHPDDQALEIVLRNGVQAVARYLGLMPDDDGDDSNGDHSIAITRHSYGEGRTVFMGFDILAHASITGADPLLGELLLTALQDTTPAVKAVYTAGDPIAIQLTQTNQGIATSVQTTLTLPAGTEVLDSRSAQIAADGTIVWVSELAENQSVEITLWLRLPTDITELTNVSMQIQIQVGTAGNWQAYDSRELQISVQPGKSYDDILTELQGLTPADDYDSVIEDITEAKQADQQGQYQLALSELIEATDDLISLQTQQADSLRHQLYSLITRAARNIQAI